MALRIKELQEKLRRRSIWEVAVAYGAGALGVLGVADLAAGIIGLPGWALPLTFLLCLMALPLVLATAVVEKTSLRDGLPSVVVPPRGIRRWLTWRTAVITLAVGFGTLATAVTGYMGMRILGIGPPATLISGDLLEEHAQLVLADVRASEENSDLARALNQGIRDDFLQSRVVTLSDHRAVDTILLRMKRSPAAPLDPETAREVAVRGGMPAVIEPEIQTVGDGFIFHAQIVAPGSGEVMDAFRVATSNDPEEILEAMDRLSKGLRGIIGESYRSLRRSRPLPEVTTQSLEALERYAESFRAEDYESNIALLEEALDIDPTFAMAWRRLGAQLSTNAREPARAKDAFTNAFNHRERLPDRERYNVEAVYYRNVEEDPQRAIEAWETRLKLFPYDRDFNDRAARYNLGVTYRDAPDPVGRLDRAEEVLSEGLERYRSCGFAGELTRALIRQGKMDEAKERWRDSSCSEGEGGRLWSATMAASAGDYNRSEGDLLRTLKETKDDGFQRLQVLSILVSEYATQGRWAEAETFAREFLAGHSWQSLPPQIWDNIIEWARLQLKVGNDTTTALAVLEDVVSPFSAGDADPAATPHVLWSAAEVYAWAGEIEKSRALLLQLDSLGSPPVPEFQGASPYLRGLLDLEEGRLDSALKEFRAAEVGGECPVLCVAPGLAETYEALGQADSALAVYERYITTPYEYRLFRWDAYFLGPALERAGQLADERGQRERAADYYRRLAELWADADPEFRHRAEAARHRLEELGSR